ncbi:MAG: virulence RhuM family protein [Bacteroidaceae bacterium]|nr:virulence RhuM family protein [Bacteroidaceae bacterium]
MANQIQTSTNHTQQGEIILYQPDETVRLEVRLEDDTVWLTQQQISILFQRERSVISKHINNAFKEGECDQESNVHFLHIPNSDKPVMYYSLDVIISVGYRVKSLNGTKFRRWANGVLKDYMLRGYATCQKISSIEKTVGEHSKEIAELRKQVDFFVRTNQPPIEGVLFEGQIFDAYKLVEVLVKSAKSEITLIDNYIDASVFDLLEKRGQDVVATIYTQHVGQSLRHTQQLSLQQYGREIGLREYSSRFHDRFLILDDALYHFGASFKDLGRRLFAFEKMSLDKNIILNQL